ncbi:TonB family protein [Flavobacterium reichenbachii]|uniref:Energy transducer TonB n=1 Tax=Flavobacterium reichenbachii TaxID=362418 RepID=A0A085ZSZ4_9FLAO|nr:TonB family protein [Flavobacterium reichenbachii]KFF07558.1 energy transducer TonB [Flavobacterium reichenbachii]OXB14201.1 energy transducer TonB [Flavobacterium reichenbachii]
MNRKYLLVFLFLFPNFFFSQSSNDKMVYLDSLWKETSREKHKYFRIVRDYYLDKDEYRFEDYYSAGKIQMEGNSGTKDNLLRRGDFIYYYENGNKKSTCSYEKGRLIGSKTEWYEDGNKKLEGENVPIDGYLTDFKVNQYWNSKNIQTVIDGNGDYEETDEKLTGSGKVKNGLKDGVWKGKDGRFKYTYTELYENGKLTKGTSIDSLSKEHTYTQAFVMAKPKKGLEHFYKFIGDKFRIPKSAQGISGKIYLEFIIKQDGSIEKIRVLKSAGYGLDEEAIRLIREYPDWGSGEIRGIKIKVLYAIPITIKT